MKQYYLFNLQDGFWDYYKNKYDLPFGDKSYFVSGFLVNAPINDEVIKHEFVRAGERSLHYFGETILEDHEPKTSGLVETFNKGTFIVTLSGPGYNTENHSKFEGDWTKYAIKDNLTIRPDFTWERRKEIDEGFYLIWEGTYAYADDLIVFSLTERGYLSFYSYVPVFNKDFIKYYGLMCEIDGTIINSFLDDTFSDFSNQYKISGIRPYEESTINPGDRGQLLKYFIINLDFQSNGYYDVGSWSGNTNTKYSGGICLEAYSGNITEPLFIDYFNEKNGYITEPLYYSYFGGMGGNVIQNSFDFYEKNIPENGYVKVMFVNPSISPYNTVFRNLEITTSSNVSILPDYGALISDKVITNQMVAGIETEVYYRIDRTKELDLENSTLNGFALSDPSAGDPKYSGYMLKYEDPAYPFPNLPINTESGHIYPNYDGLTSNDISDDIKRKYKNNEIYITELDNHRRKLSFLTPSWSNEDYVENEEIIEERNNFKIEITKERNRLYEEKREEIDRLYKEKIKEISGPYEETRNYYNGIIRERKDEIENTEDEIEKKKLQYELLEKEKFIKELLKEPERELERKLEKPRKEFEEELKKLEREIKEEINRREIEFEKKFKYISDNFNRTIKLDLRTTKRKFYFAIARDSQIDTVKIKGRLFHPDDQDRDSVYRKRKIRDDKDGNVILDENGNPTYYDEENGYGFTVCSPLVIEITFKEDMYALTRNLFPYYMNLKNNIDISRSDNFNQTINFKMPSRNVLLFLKTEKLYLFTVFKSKEKDKKDGDENESEEVLDAISEISHEGENKLPIIKKHYLDDRIVIEVTFSSPFFEIDREHLKNQLPDVDDIEYNDRPYKPNEGYDIGVPQTITFLMPPRDLTLYIKERTPLKTLIIKPTRYQFKTDESDPPETRRIEGIRFKGQIYTFKNYMGETFSVIEGENIDIDVKFSDVYQHIDEMNLCLQWGKIKVQPAGGKEFSREEEYWQHFDFIMPNEDLTLSLKWEERLYSINFNYLSLFFTNLSIFDEYYCVKRNFNKNRPVSQSNFPYYAYPVYSEGGVVKRNKIRIYSNLSRSILIQDIICPDLNIGDLASVTGIPFLDISFDAPKKDVEIRAEVYIPDNKLIILVTEYSTGSINLVRGTYELILAGGKGGNQGNGGAAGGWAFSSNGEGGAAGNYGCAEKIIIYIETPTILEYKIGQGGFNGSSGNAGTDGFLGIGSSNGGDGGNGGGGGASVIFFDNKVRIEGKGNDYKTIGAYGGDGGGFPNSGGDPTSTQGRGQSGQGGGGGTAGVGLGFATFGGNESAGDGGDGGMGHCFGENYKKKEYLIENKYTLHISDSNKQALKSWIDGLHPLLREMGLTNDEYKTYDGFICIKYLGMDHLVL